MKAKAGDVFEVFGPPKPKFEYMARVPGSRLGLGATSWAAPRGVVHAVQSGSGADDEIPDPH